MKGNRIFAYLMCALLLLLSACDEMKEENNTSDGDKIQIVTTIAQISEPISVIGGDRVNVKSLMGPGVDPHLYEATQGDIVTLQKANIIFYSGLHLEGKMTEIFEKTSETIPTIALSNLVEKERLLTDAGGAVDPHIWFDINIWKDSLNVAVEELKKYSPDDAEYFEANKMEYFKKLDLLKEEAMEKLKSIPKEQRVLVTAHDAFSYFGRLFDIEVVGLQGLSTEDEVGISDIQSTVNLLIERKIPSVFIETSINENTIRAVIDGAAEEGHPVTLGGSLYSDAMGEEGTDEGTYLGMYRYNVNTIYDALTGGGN